MKEKKQKKIKGGMKAPPIRPSHASPYETAHLLCKPVA